MKIGPRRVRFRGLPEIDTILVDATDTLLKGEDDRDRFGRIIAIAQEVLGTALTIDCKEFAKRLYELRFVLARSRRLSFEAQAGADYWGMLNAAILNTFPNVSCTPAQGRKISRRYVAGLDGYRIPRDRRAFFRSFLKQGFGRGKAGRGARAFVVSNSSPRMIETAIESAGVGDLFAGVFTPHRLGGLRKPNPLFYRIATEQIGADPKRTLMIGDSPFFDLAGARAGLWVLWLGDSYQEMPVVAAEKMYGRQVWKRILCAESLDEAKQVIGRSFWSKRRPRSSDVAGHFFML